MTSSPPDIVVILGPTASGKTGVAANLASEINGEIISADSRQVYRQLNLGTGKDYDDYNVHGKTVPCHLIDIADPGYQFNVYEYQQYFLEAYHDIVQRKKVPVLCGGTGLYLEAALRGFKLISVPVNEPLRKELESKSLEELTAMLAAYRNLHNTTDTSQKKRTVRAIEIEEYYINHPDTDTSYPQIHPLYMGVKFDRGTERQRITNRLKQRLDAGMIDEVKHLLEQGLTPEQLIYYGLEYKFITLYLTGKLTYNDMFSGLNTAIHQFAKRQMTWFRRMERNGIKIHWLDGFMPMEEKIARIVELLG